MPTQVDWADKFRRWREFKINSTTVTAAMTSVRSLLRYLSGGIIGVIRGRGTASRKRSADAHTSTEIDAAECATDDREPRVDLYDWLVGTLTALDEAASRTTPPAGVSRCVDVVDGSRYVDEDEGLVLTDVEREAGKSTIYEEDTEDPGGLLTSSLHFDPFDPMPPSLQMKRNASLSKCTSDKPRGVLLGGAGKRGRAPEDEGKGAMSPAERKRSICNPVPTTFGRYVPQFLYRTTQTLVPYDPNPCTVRLLRRSSDHNTPDQKSVVRPHYKSLVVCVYLSCRERARRAS